MQSRNDTFNENYVVNSTIINTPNLPIFVFIKELNGDFTLNGVYNYVTHHTEEDDSKWFHLVNRTSNYEDVLIDKEFSDRLLEGNINNSQNANADERRRRLQTANPTPNKQSSIVTTYDRNPDVVAEVLHRANGVCECCNRPAPFIKVNGEPYLEVHHVIPLSQDGEDTVENAEALCPNCHREKHYGINYQDAERR